MPPPALKRLLLSMLGPALLDESRIVHAAFGTRRGVMLDVGAHHGSSLAPFADDGWTIHAFEPDPMNRARLQAEFGDRRNVMINPVAVAGHLGEMPLFTSEQSTGISSLVPFTDTHKQTGTVMVTTLATYLAQAGIDRVDFLKIDVEGYERNVLIGNDWTIKPDVILLEFEDSKTIPLGYSWKDLASDLTDRGYAVLVSEWFPIQNYGATHRWRRFETYPTELDDAAGWGNLIATTELDRILPEARRAAVRYRVRSRIERVVRRGRTRSTEA